MSGSRVCSCAVQTRRADSRELAPNLRVLVLEHRLLLSFKYLCIELLWMRLVERKLDVKKLWMENPGVTKRRPPAEPDSIDPQLQVWGRELPSLDLETEGIVERIWKLEHHLDRSLRDTLDAHDLSQGEWRLMGHLRYAGKPYRGKPGKLAQHLGLSSGAMTNRLDNMEERGLLRRLDDPDDRRGVIVELTKAGQKLWEVSVDAQAQKEALVASALNETEKRQLNDLLRRLMNAFEALHGPARKKSVVE